MSAVLFPPAYAGVPTVRIGPGPPPPGGSEDHSAMVFGPETLGASDWQTRALEIFTRWLSVHPSTQPAGARDVEARKQIRQEALGESERLSKLVVQIIDFARNITDESE